MAETDDALKASKLRLTKKRLFFMKQADLNPGAAGAEWLKDGVQAIDLLQSALTERDATIERLTKERDEALRMKVAAQDARDSFNRDMVTAERDLAEARAEVERKDAALSLIAEGHHRSIELARAALQAGEAGR